MKCTNKTCDKTIIEPLVLYNGKWVCPFCRKALVNENIVFKVTKENDDLFRLSEIFYFNSIKEADELKKEYYIKNAVEKCRLAASLGHPKAYQRLGFYYDKDYVELNRSEVARCQMAYQYYATVCYSTSNELTIENSVKNKNISLLDIKKETAELMLKMLIEFGDGELLDDSYSFERNAKKVQETLGVIIDETRKISTMKQDKLSKILTTLKECTNKKRAPLFGVFTAVSIDDLNTLFTTHKKDVLSLIKNEDLFLGYFEYKDTLFNSIAGDYLFGLANYEKIKDDIDRLQRKNKKQIVLVFCNKKNGHNLLKKKELLTVEKYIKNTNNQFLSGMIYNIIQNNKNGDGRIFYEDDVYYYLNSHNIPNALEQLKNK